MAAASSSTRLELILLIIMFIYGAKVFLVFVYVGDVSPIGGAVYDHVSLSDATAERLVMERRRRHDMPAGGGGAKSKDSGESQGRDSENVNTNGSRGSRDSNFKNDSVLGVAAVPIQPPSDEEAKMTSGELSGEILVSAFEHSAEKCRDVFMVAIINSQPRGLDYRMAVRETWADTAMAQRLGVLTMFALDTPGAHSTKSSVFQENEKHDDLLVGAFAENPLKSTLKMLMGLEWVTSRCPSVKFVFAGDDHMFVMYERLVRKLRSLDRDESHELWTGRISRATTPERNPDSRYYVSEQQFTGNRYPDFCTSEAGYVFSVDAAKTIAYLGKRTRNDEIIPLPDVFTGVLAKEAGISIKEDKSFTYGDLANDVCELSKVITTRVRKSPDHMTTIWKNVTDAEFQKDCPEPDLDVVLGSGTNNRPYVQKALRLLLDHPEACYNSDGKEDNVFIVILISSLPRHFELRRTIRNTWGAQKQVLGKKLKLLFVMGKTQRDVDIIQRQVKEEDDEFGDIIQAEFVESFQNLTLKVVMGLRWVSKNCAHAAYMYKGDDDMFVNFNHIVSYLNENRAKGPAMARFFLGSVLYRSVRVTRVNSKYYVPDKLYSGRYFPPYCSGGGYVISTDIIPEMYMKSMETAFIPIDDAYQGILASKIGVKPVSHKGFKNWGAKTDGCSLRDVMVVHGFKTPDALSGAWKNYTMNAEDCPAIS